MITRIRLFFPVLIFSVAVSLPLGSALAIPLRVSGSDSTYEIRSVTKKSKIFLSCDDIERLLPITVRRDPAGGMFVLCATQNCIPVFLLDSLEAQIKDSSIYIQADRVAEVLGGKAKVSKKEAVFTCPLPLPSARVGSAVGDPAPGFRLPAAKDSVVSLAELLARGPAVIAFIRSGEWDPISQSLLSSLQAKMDSLDGAGVSVAAVHGYEMQVAARWIKSLHLTFPQLADESCAVMRGYDVFDKGRLAIPSVFVIDQTGVIRLRLVFADINSVPDISPLMETIRLLFAEQGR